jgi:hypothetical protein
MNQTPTDAELSAQLENARETMTAYGTALRQDVDFAAKLKRGVRKNPLAWFGGATLLGLLLSKVPRMRHNVILAKPKTQQHMADSAGKAAFTALALKVAAELSKPAIARWWDETRAARQRRS